MLRKAVLSLAALGLVGAATMGAAGVAAAAPAATGASAILDSGINFSEPDGSQGIGGNVGDCVAVQLPSTGSIQFVTGTLTLFTGPKCTGKSLVVKKDVADLVKLGFGHTLSVRVGAA